MKRIMRRSRAAISGLMAAGLILSLVMGCANPPSALENDYGFSVTNNKARQIVNPRAALQVEVSTGQPPRAATNTMDAYDKSFSPQERRGTTLKLTTDQ
ncbi:MAG: hypothetical protein FJ128_00245 [Deltaproteobacteria bacterium]|nr:hypothetical protein [Deltaproteobacteria bacterium]